MDRVIYFADLSVRRACGFAILAIFTATVGMSYDALLAVRMGAISTTLMVVILLLKAYQAPKRNYKRTETWILLEKRHEFPEARAQAIFGAILQDVYLWYATATAATAAILWAVSLVVRIARAVNPVAPV